MGVGGGAAQVEAQAQAFGALGGRGGAEEALEEAGLIGEGNSGTAVADRQACATGGGAGAQADGDGRGRGRVLGGVLQVVHQHAAHALGVGLDRQRMRRQVQRHLAATGGAEHLDHLAHQLREIEGRRLHVDDAQIHARAIQQIVHQRREAAQLGPGDRQIVRGDRLADGQAVLAAGHGHAQSAQRVLQLVRRHRDDRVGVLGQRGRRRRDGGTLHAVRSRSSAIPCPTPMHMLARPWRAPGRR